MPRRKRAAAQVVEPDDELTLGWRYGRFTRPLATDLPEIGEAIVARIASERDRLDGTQLPLADRLAALERFVIELGYPSHARRAMESSPPEGWTPRR